MYSITEGGLLVGCGHLSPEMEERVGGDETETFIFLNKKKKMM